MNRVELLTVQTSNQGDIQYVFDDNTAFVYETVGDAINDYTQYFFNLDLNYFMKMLLLKNKIENGINNSCVMDENNQNGLWVVKQ